MNHRQRIPPSRKLLDRARTRCDHTRVNAPFETRTRGIFGRNDNRRNDSTRITAKIEIESRHCSIGYRYVTMSLDNCSPRPSPWYWSQSRKRYSLADKILRAKKRAQIRLCLFRWRLRKTARDHKVPTLSRVW